mmetsp:Transcript_98006/g.315685  ORF Transcript_98006/g.315685 Transcript_98006/m.315685 type:complete len:427 (-) Transcript_98006:47-1327(-)
MSTLVRSTSQCSGGSSLALSALSTPETAHRDLATPKRLLGDDLKREYASRRDTERSASSTITGKFDLSDFLAPLEARLSAHIESVEAMVERRCGALERQLADLASGASSGGREAGEDLKVSVQSLQDRMATQEVRCSDLLQQLQTCSGGHTACIAEIWRQVRADRQDGMSKFQNLSDALEIRLQALCEKVKGPLAESVEPPSTGDSAATNAPAGQLAALSQRGEAGPPAAPAGASGIVRWRSDGPAIRRSSSPSAELHPQQPQPQQPKQLLLRECSAEDPAGAGPLVGPYVQRFGGSAPSSPPIQQRVGRAPSPGAVSVAASASLGERPTSRPLQQPRAVAKSSVVPGQQSSLLGSRSVGTLDRSTANPASPLIGHRSIGQASALPQRQSVQRMYPGQELGRTLPQQPQHGFVAGPRPTAHPAVGP